MRIETVMLPGSAIDVSSETDEVRIGSEFAIDANNHCNLREAACKSERQARSQGHNRRQRE